MLRLIMELLDPKFLTTVFAAIAAAATVLTLAMPYLVNDTLSKRMKAVASASAWRWAAEPRFGNRRAPT